MRGLWTHAARPRLKGSHHLSAGDSFTSTLVRKTTTRPPRQRPSFADHVFTVLLTPVLAAALFVDTSWKAKQRRDWDERLAAVNDEINQLKERERQLMSSVQLRNIRHGLSQQRRGYASVAHAPLEIEDDEIPGEIEMPTWEEETSLDHDGSVDDKSQIRKVLSAKEFSPEQLSNFRRYHRLNAITLALRMLLHLRIGPNPFYSLTGDDDPVDIAALASLDTAGEVSLPTDTDRLVQMLALTRKQMRSLRNLEDLFYAAPHIQAAANRGTLHQTIQQLTMEFDSGNVPLPGLIDGYGKAILQSKEAPCISVYVMLIRSLSKVGSYSLAYHAAAAMKNSTLPLSDTAVFYMLLQIGRACDSRSLNNLLHFIANTDNPMNLIHRWEKTCVNSLDLPVPTTLNPRLLMALVYVALRCEQPERAEAWLSLLREADYGSVWKDDLFRSFLAYHSHHRNWEEGKKWLKRCVDHALTIADQSIDRLARVIYRMLDLCVRCRKLAEYTAILDAAVDSGIGPPPVDKSQNDYRKFHPRTRSILLEWEAFPLPDNTEECPVEKKARSFQYACKSLIKVLSHKPQTAQIEQESEADTALMASTASNPSQRYAVRRRGRNDPDSVHIVGRVTEDFDKLQSKVAEQEALISEMKARFDLSVRRQKSYEEEAAARTQKWTQSANRLGEEVQDTLKRFQKLKVGSSEQEAAILQLKIRTALSASRQEEEAARAQRQTNDAFQMTKELQELKENFKELQKLNETHQHELAKTRQEIMHLKGAAKTVAEHPQQARIRNSTTDERKPALQKDALSPERGNPNEHQHESDLALPQFKTATYAVTSERNDLWVAIKQVQADIERLSKATQSQKSTETTTSQLEMDALLARKKDLFQALKQTGREHRALKTAEKHRRKTNQLLRRRQASSSGALTPEKGALFAVQKSAREADKEAESSPNTDHDAGARTEPTRQAPLLPQASRISTTLFPIERRASGTGRITQAQAPELQTPIITKIASSTRLKNYNPPALQSRFSPPFALH